MDKVVLRKSVLLNIVFCLIADMIMFGCAQLPPLPPIASTNFVLADDEKRHWEESDQYEKLLEKRNMFFIDPEMNIFLSDVAQRLCPPQIFAIIPFKIRVIRNVRANAAAFPNGLILLHTGILSRLQNESQLAMILAHEMTHTINRHAVNQMRKTRNADFMVVSNIVYSGYAKELELEADAVGLRLMAEAGYDPREGVHIFELFKKMEEDKKNDAFFFKTHPDLMERIKKLTEILSQHPAEKKISDDGMFLKRINGAILGNGELHLQAGEFKEAEKSAEKSLKIGSLNAEAYTLLGKTHKKKGDVESLTKARDCFDKAIATNAAYSEAYKEKGLLHMKNGEKEKAATALNKYLVLAGDSADRKLIEAYIKQCRKGTN